MTFFIDTQDKRNIVVKSLLEQKYQVDEIKNISHAQQTDIFIFAPNKKFDNIFLKTLPNKTTLICGKLLDEQIQILEKKNITYINILQDKVFAIQNSNLTAEGILCHLLTDTEKSLYDLNILILGNGKVGKATAQLFSKLDLHFSIASHDKDNYALCYLFSQNNYYKKDFIEKLNNFDVIINTIPSKILTENDITKINKDALYLEISSLQSLDVDAKTKFQFVLCPALPQKFSAKTAGKFFYEAILRELEL